MKIELDLLQAHVHPDVGGAALVALMTVLPADEVEHAVLKWRAGLAVHEQPDAPAVAPQPEAPVVGASSWTTAAPQPEAPAAASASEQPQKFTYRGRTFSPKKRGPSAAHQQAREDITLCTTVEALDKLQLDIERLRAWFIEVGHPDRADAITETMRARRAELEAKDVPVVAPDAQVHEDIPFEAPEEQRAGPPTPREGNGAAAADDLAGMDLRALCRHAEHEVGREKVVEVLQRHGVAKLSGLGANLEAAVRADVAGLLAG